MEVNFYQVDDIIYKSIAPLLIKVLEDNKKALIYCENDKQIEEIDNGLWSFSKTKFVPHATHKEKDHSKHPIIITGQQQNHNNAEYLIKFLEAEGDFVKGFEKTFYFFGSGNIDEARKLWAKYKKQSCKLNFYKKNQDKWEKVNL